MHHTWIAVESSLISAIAHTSDCLYVRFPNGKEYEYSGVPSNVIHEFLAADSKGKFFSTRIKGKYSYRAL